MKVYVFCVVPEFIIQSGTPLYGHPFNTDTRYYGQPSLGPAPYIFLQMNPLNIRTPRNTDTFSGPNGVSNNGV